MFAHTVLFANPTEVSIKKLFVEKLDFFHQAIRRFKLIYHEVRGS